MELSLNVLWLAVVLTTTVVWKTGWAQLPRRTSRTALEQWTALASISIFLFFAISLSDDLHAETVIIEDPRQRHAVALDCLDRCAHQVLRTADSHIAMLPASVEIFLFQAFRPVTWDCAPTAPSIAARQFPDRSPPPPAA